MAPPQCDWSSIVEHGVDVDASSVGAQDQPASLALDQSVAHDAADDATSSDSSARPGSSSRARSSALSGTRTSAPSLIGPWNPLPHMPT